MSATDDAPPGTIDHIIARHAGLPGPLLPLLHALQDELGHVPDEAVPRIAQALNLSRAEVHGVISFYHHFRRHPAGRHVVRICRAEACQAMHVGRVEAHAQQVLGVSWHGTTSDGAFTLEPVYCLGNCAAAPTVMIGERLYGRVTPERLAELLARWRESA